MWPVTCDTVTITVTSDVHQPQPATNHTSSIASTVLRRAFCSSQSSEGTKLYNFCASYFCYLQLFSPVGSMLMKYWHMVVISEASDVWNIICHHVQSITSLELKSLVNNPESASYLADHADCTLQPRHVPRRHVSGSRHGRGWCGSVDDQTGGAPPGLSFPECIALELWPPTPVVDPLANVGSCHNGKCNQEPARLNQAKLLFTKEDQMMFPL